MKRYPKIGTYISDALLALIVNKSIDKDVVIGSSDMAQLVWALRKKGWPIVFSPEDARYGFFLPEGSCSQINNWVFWAKKEMDQAYDNSNWLYRLFHARPSKAFLCKMAK